MPGAAASMMAPSMPTSPAVVPFLPASAKARGAIFLDRMWALSKKVCGVWRV